MKLFISADIEGCTGTTLSEETHKLDVTCHLHISRSLLPGFCRPYDGRSAGGLRGGSGSRCR